MAIKMKFKKKIGRVTDILQDLGVASLAIGLFQGKSAGFWLGVVCLLASVVFTREEV